MSAARSVRRGVAVRAGLLVAGLVGACLAATAGGHASAAGTNGGALVIRDGSSQVLTAGGSTTQFALTPPTGAACSGDTATGGYHVQSFMVPSTVSLPALTFNNSGPIAPSGVSFVAALYANSSAFTNKNTAVTTGVLTNLPLFDFSVWSPGNVPAGTYSIGYACTKGTAGPTQLDRYWSAQIDVITSQSDPAGFTWTAAAAPPATTTTAATTTTTAVTTTTSAASTTSSSSVVDTTVASSSSTTIAGSTTTVAGSGGLVNTGFNAQSAIIGALLLLFVGRMGVLLARRIRVIPPRS